MHQILKHSHYRNCCVNHNQISYSDKDHEVITVGGPNMPQTNPRWKTAAILKIDKSQYLEGFTDLDEIWRDDATRLYESHQPIKLQHLKKSRMADSRHLQNLIKFLDFKNPKWCTAAFLKIKNTIF